jgi:hypothetical protein
VKTVFSANKNNNCFFAYADAFLLEQNFVWKNVATKTLYREQMPDPDTNCLPFASNYILLVLRYEK